MYEAYFIQFYCFEGIKPGHMPGAISIPFTSVMDEKTKLMKSPGRLRAMFKAKGVDLDKPLTATCGSGES
jgi:thiosulfate/3-mercaptopyruvate sulfurtransferase